MHFPQGPQIFSPALTFPQHHMFLIQHQFAKTMLPNLARIMTVSQNLPSNEAIVNDSTGAATVSTLNPKARIKLLKQKESHLSTK